MDLWPAYAFTPDGKSLVFTNHGKIVRLDLASRQVQDIPFTARVEQSLAPRVSWQEKVASGPIAARILRWPNQSSDGKWIAFDAFGRVYLQEVANGQASGAPKRLTPDAAGAPPREYAPSFSPDGKWIAYVTWSDADGGRGLEGPGARRRSGSPRATHEGDGPLRQPGLVSQGRPDRRDPRIRTGAARPAAGRRGVLRDPVARRGRRGHALRHVGPARATR